MVELPGEHRPLRAAEVLRDGLLAGLLGAICVAVVHLVYDAVTADALRTPAVLHALAFGGEAASPANGLDVAAVMQYSAIHLVSWAIVGVALSLLVSVSDSYPKLWYAAMTVAGFFACSVVYLTFAADAPGLSGLNLWLGTVAGGAVMARYLTQRHPGVLKQRERAALTTVGTRYLALALATERQAMARHEQAKRAVGPCAELDEGIANRRRRIDELCQLYDRFDLSLPPEPGLPTDPEPSSCHAALEEATRHEGEIVALYDRFLAALDEQKIRDVFQSLRADSQECVQSGFGRRPAD